ncbi:heterogeneous nuclear ribonucleoprotein L-like isoform X2 [Limulus polyphemus]|uniref:Heterogeneous nuclear ribonucleoprotein L-like isoform X2 n=1 Tax=Limulus polyphemus TaxID=6850 RepID=A0ABM1T2K2_LIMPO|nr:heterogeneous nuclear ribonucleoprotein L-like isoform X2 [Limulus polyphemus]
MAYNGHPAKRIKTEPDARGYGYGYAPNRGGGRGQDEDRVNHILLMTILNPAYPITVDVIHTISSPSGKVQRIVIFKKNGVQAMVEFDSVESAKRAKQSLNGADIYSGCCTLKIEYAKPKRLNVFKNDNESWDYTNPTLGKAPGNERPALLQEPPRFGGGPQNFTEGGRGPPVAPGYGPDRGDGFDGYDNSGPRSVPPAPGGYGAGEPYAPQDRYGGPPPPDRFGRFGGGRDAYDGRPEGPPPGPPGPRGPGYGPMGGPPPGGAGPHQGSVMMVYGLNPEKMNADKLFNLFCLYGNVIRIKFLKSKEGCAMIQMGDPIAVEKSVTHMNGAMFFDHKMNLGYSKQAFLNDVQQPYELPDGTPSFKDYMGNKNNRFTTPEAAMKNRIAPPSKMLHFFNTPSGITEDELKKLFEDAGVKPPVSVKKFQSKSERSSSGLLEFAGVSDALEALAVVNHKAIPNPDSKFPYITKLCFSTTGPRF